jgi:subtilisin family serine protease
MRLLPKIRSAAATAGVAAAVLLLTGVPSSASSPPAQHHAILGVDGGGISGAYMVTLKDNPLLRHDGLSARAHTLTAAHQGRLERTFDEAGRDFAVRMSPAEAQKLADDPNVEHVVEQRNYDATGSEVNPPRGLDRIGQRPSTIDNAYYSDDFSAGAGVHVYVVDSGIRIHHPEIDGRASMGFNALDGTTNADDCAGHGSHLAGIIGGNTYGVAKKAQLIAVKVFNCDGVGTDPQVLAGINWVINDVAAHRAQGPWPAVMDLAVEPRCTEMDRQTPKACPAGTSSDVVNAENRAIFAGITVVSSAGNQNIDACGNPIATAPGVIVVGATDRGEAGGQPADIRWQNPNNPNQGSNWGNCVSIWAPGATIDSIGGVHRSKTGEVDPDPVAMTGTSQAVAHAAGAVAILLSTPQFAAASPFQIAAELDTQATLGAISGLQANQGPNKLLYVQPTYPHSGTSIAMAHNANGALTVFGTNTDATTGPGQVPNGHMFLNTQTTPGSTAWSGFTRSQNAGWTSVGAATNQNGRMENFGLTTTDQIFRRQQTAQNSPGFLSLSQLDGLLTSVTAAKNANGTLETFGANRQGQLFFRAQTVAGDETTWAPTWGQFTLPTGLPFAVRASTVAAGTDAAGRIEVFFLDTHGNIWTTQQSVANTDTWTPFAQLSDTDHRLMTELAVARHSDGRLDLVATDATDGVFHRSQGAGGAFTSWSPLPAKTLFHLAAETNPDGTVQVAGVDNTGAMWQTRQDTPDSTTFLPWTTIPGGILRP